MGKVCGGVDGFDQTGGPIVLNKPSLVILVIYESNW